jgi:4a-hydroxytetrahydrobiopterin dehydratase
LFHARSFARPAAVCKPHPPPCRERGNDFLQNIKDGLANSESVPPIFGRTFQRTIQHPYMSELLEEEELTSALKKCPEWEYEKKHITRTIEFEEFMEGIDFVNDVGEISEEAQHHPDIMIKHTKVTLKLTTHDVGGVTALDIQLAQRIDNLVD